VIPDDPTETPADEVPTEPIDPIATATATATATIAVTREATVAPTAAPIDLGDTALTIETVDGPRASELDEGQACIGDVCLTIGSTVRAASTSSQTLLFSGFLPGTYLIAVTGVTPYADAIGGVTVEAGETAEVTITLVLAETPETPPGPGAATPVVDETTVPGETDEGQPGAIVEAPALAANGVSAPDGVSAAGDGERANVSVQALPNTGIGRSAFEPSLASSMGIGSDVRLASLMLLLLSGGVVVVAGGVVWRRRGRS